MLCTFCIVNFSHTSLFLMRAANFSSQHTKSLVASTKSQKKGNHRDMNNNLFMSHCTSDKESIVNSDNGWEEEWDEDEHESTLMLVLFSNHIMKCNRQSNWIYDHIVWNGYVQQLCQLGKFQRTY